jgi:hypothetical protein
MSEKDIAPLSEEIFGKVLELQLTNFIQQRGDDPQGLSMREKIDMVYNKPDVIPHFADYLIGILSRISIMVEKFSDEKS